MTAPIRSMPELIAALRARRDELNISHETIDNIAGLQPGYTSKLLAPVPIKNLGQMSFQAMLGALGMALVAVPDPQMIAKVGKHWQKRKRPQRLLIAEASIAQEIQIVPELAVLIGSGEWRKMRSKQGGKRRAKILGKRARQRIASHAARMRWSKARA